MSYHNSGNEDSIVGSVIGLFVGVGLIIAFSAGFYLVERYYCQNYATNEFIKHNFVETSVDNIDSDKEGKLVRFSGMTTTNEVLTDNTFNVSVENSLSLNRVVEMYQYTEKNHRHRERRGKNSYRTYYTYTYDKGWHKNLINSSAFSFYNTYKNPKTMGYKNENFAAKNVTIGAHKIPTARVRTLPTSVKVSIDYSKINLPIISAKVYDDYIYFNVDNERIAKEDKEKSAHGLLLDDRGRPMAFEIEKYQVNVNKPEIGDVRIHFSKHPICEATILGKQAQDTVVPFRTEYRDVLEIKEGNLSVEQIISEGAKAGQSTLWIARICLFSFISLGCFIAFYKMQLLGCLFALSNSFVMATGIISFVWRPYQPLLGYCCLGLMILGCFCSFMIWASRK